MEYQSRTFRPGVFSITFYPAQSTADYSVFCFCFSGLIIYEEDETTPSVPLPMNIKIPCQQMKTYIDDDKILSDVFESMSIKSQSF